MEVLKENGNENECEEFVTVVSVGTNIDNNNQVNNYIESNTDNGFITVLTIGNEEESSSLQLSDTISEEVFVYRLPGERLGFSLKFEGGTKTTEYVRKLFIQSCAFDSPASRVRCTWGALIEGDELLQIDTRPITTMTRIDCVRALKDSNVVIKLLVKHNVNNNIDITSSNVNDDSTMYVCSEMSELEQALVKPPPVPPRKMSRKSINKQTEKCPPDINPPNAEVYLDLLSQELECSIKTESESDDTGSTVSTIIDRQNVIDSIPSTPTAVQKQMDLTKVLNPFEMLEMEYAVDMQPNSNDDFLFTRFVTSHDILMDCEQNKNINNCTEPVTNFQDASLSYGNENVIIAANIITDSPSDSDDFPNENLKIPKPVPRKCYTKKMQQQEQAENDTATIDSNLPRLVNFVPKVLSRTLLPQKQECVSNNNNNNNNAESIETDTKNIEIDKVITSSAWSLRNHLTTIGEIEELEICANTETKEKEDETESNCEQRENNDQPIINNGNDHHECETKQNDSDMINEIPFLPNNKEISEDKEISTDIINNTIIMDTQSDQSQGIIKSEYSSLSSLSSPPLSFSSRLPPDGQEFPSLCEETSNTMLTNITHSSSTWTRTQTNSLWRRNEQQSSGSVKDKIAIFSATENVQHSLTNSSMPIQYSAKLKKNDKNSEDIKETVTMTNTNEEPKKSTKLHTRSQSMLDLSYISSLNNSNGNARRLTLNNLIEQRRKSLSKLRGLVIPAYNEVQPISGTIDLPEIQSMPSNQMNNNNSIITSSNDIVESLPSISQQQPSPTTTSVLHSPLWNSNNTITNNFPRYSPAFKRKCLQVHVTDQSNKNNETIATRTTDKADLETKYSYNDDDDCDSAVSSSQSSYENSLSSSSPVENYSSNIIENESNNRILKAQSIEAINRMNILASAKCRSGKDLKTTSLFIPKKIHKNNDEFDKMQVKEKTNGNQVIINRENFDSQNVNVIKNKQYEPKSLLQCNAKEKTINKRHLYDNGKKRASVIDIRKQFEQFEIEQQKCIIKKYKTNNTITAVKSPSSIPNPIVSQQDVDKIVKEANENADKKNGSYIINVEDVITVVLRRESSGGNIGITLTGGMDYETKEITIHKILTGSCADKDGRLKKGYRILAINDKRMIGLTHKQSIDILKNPCPEVVLVVLPCNATAAPSSSLTTHTYNAINNKISEQNNNNNNNNDNSTNIKSSVIHHLELVKDGTGLGFSLDGGRDSPKGDKPLIIKKIFTGGIAEKNGNLFAGDELIQVNDIDVSKMTRIEVWGLMKKLPDGKVLLTIRRN